MRFFWVTILSAIFIVSSLSAAENGATRVPRFSVHDLDYSGQLDRHEYDKFIRHRSAHRQARGRASRGVSEVPAFESIDVDANGLISEEELIKALNMSLRKQRRLHAREQSW